MKARFEGEVQDRAGVWPHGRHSASCSCQQYPHGLVVNLPAVAPECKVLMFTPSLGPDFPDPETPNKD